MTADQELLLTPEETARLLRISERTLRRWAKAGKIKSKRFGPKTIRYPRHLIEQLAHSELSGVA